MTLSDEVLDAIQSEIVSSRISGSTPIVAQVFELLAYHGFKGPEILLMVVKCLPIIDDGLNRRREVEQKLREAISIAEGSV